MSVEGLCAICEANTAEYGCDLCGRMVCEKHYVVDDGVCVECESRSGPRPDDSDRRQKRPDGVDEYRF